MAETSTRHRRKPLKKASAHVGPNMTPMVDVVMCILIFFMLGSSFVVPELFLKSNTAALDKGGLGTEQGTQKLPPTKMNIVLKRAGREAVGDAGAAGAAGGDAGALTWVTAGDAAPLPMNKIDDQDTALNDAILGRLKALRERISDDVQVLIVPEGRVPYQDVITIYDYCTKLQFKQVAFYPAK